MRPGQLESNKDPHFKFLLPHPGTLFIVSSMPSSETIHYLFSPFALWNFYRFVLTILPVGYIKNFYSCLKIRIYFLYLHHIVLLPSRGRLQRNWLIICYFFLFCWVFSLILIIFRYLSSTFSLKALTIFIFSPNLSLSHRNFLALSPATIAWLCVHLQLSPFRFFLEKFYFSFLKFAIINLSICWSQLWGHSTILDIFVTVIK